MILYKINSNLHTKIKIKRNKITISNMTAIKNSTYSLDMKENKYMILIYTTCIILTKFQKGKNFKPLSTRCSYKAVVLFLVAFISFERIGCALKI